MILLLLFGVGSEIFTLVSGTNVPGGNSFRTVSGSLMGGVWSAGWILLWFLMVFIVFNGIELLCDIADAAIERNRKESNKSMEMNVIR
jgi:amino acid transporter